MSKTKQPSKYKRKPAEEERDRHNISRLYLAGKIQAQIAQELGISQSTVSRELKIIQGEWKIERVLDLNEAKQKELAKIDNLETTLWDAWNRSVRTNTIRATKASVVGGTVVGQELTERTEEEIGDPKFLDGVARCIEARMRVLGIEAPRKTEVEIKPLESEHVRNQIKAIYDGNTPSR
jgi:predicted transcriptional regulator